VDQRVPKKMLAEHGAPTAADRRLLTEGIEELQWIAALKPGTVAIPEHRADGREYLEVAVLSVQVRATHGKASQWLRLAELVHRAVPYPVLLIQTLVPSAAATPDDGRHAPASSPSAWPTSALHRTRRARWCSTVNWSSPSCLAPTTGAASVVGPLLEAMALDRQPHQDLMALYQGWMDCLTAAEAARLTGNFRLPNGTTAAAAQREALRTCQRLEQEAARLRSQAAKERQIAKQVDLNLELQRLDARLRAARAQL
jgi:cell division septum initiation protein DivIVA